ncbi:hypothetical protein KC340_g23 [Hortaea werneckii]|nr:hypothetical protein KC340_g23 [Hortaea werneckii]
MIPSKQAIKDKATGRRSNCSARLSAYILCTYLFEIFSTQAESCLDRDEGLSVASPEGPKHAKLATLHLMCGCAIGVGKSADSPQTQDNTLNHVYTITNKLATWAHTILLNAMPFSNASIHKTVQYNEDAITLYSSNGNVVHPDTFFVRLLPCVDTAATSLYPQFLGHLPRVYPIHCYHGSPHDHRIENVEEGFVRDNKP